MLCEFQFHLLLKIHANCGASDPKFREWRHWTVVNIPGMNINAGHLAAVYVGAGPPKGTGYHRYVFLLYKQPSTINVDHVVHIQLTGKGRGGFKVLFVCLFV